MSQYPPPYPAPYPPSPYAGPPTVAFGSLPLPPGVAAPAGRRAAVMMFVTGGLLVLVGLWDGLQAATISAAQWQAQMQQQQAAMGPAGAGMPQVSFGLVRAFSFAVAVGMVAVGGTIIGLAVGVRRGGRRSTIAGLVVTLAVGGLAAVMLLLSVLFGLQVPVAFALACLFAVPVALTAVQSTWLVAALRRGSAAGGGDAYQAYLTQYYHYQQTAHAYAAASYGGQPGHPPSPPGYGQGGGYGYAAPPPQLPPPQLPPPGPPDAGGPAPQG